MKGLDLMNFLTAIPWSTKKPRPTGKLKKMPSLLHALFTFSIKLAFKASSESNLIVIFVPISSLKRFVTVELNVFFDEVSSKTANEGRASLSL